MSLETLGSTNSTCSRSQLSREEEAAIGEEKEVRKEDQDRINRFSRLHSREKAAEEDLKAKEVGFTTSDLVRIIRLTCSRKKRKTLKRSLQNWNWRMRMTKCRKAGSLQKYGTSTLTFTSYKIGDSFFSLPVSEVQEQLTSSVDKINDEVSTLEGKLGELREEMSELKAALYGRFGRSINLEA